MTDQYLTYWAQGLILVGRVSKFVVYNLLVCKTESLFVYMCKLFCGFGNEKIHKIDTLKYSEMKSLASLSLLIVRNS